MMYFDDTDELVVLGKYSDMNLADLHISVLQDKGIPAALKDQFSSQMIPFYRFGTGGIKLLVRKDDLERAAQLLEHGHPLTSDVLVEEDAWSSEECYDDATRHGAAGRIPDRCPACGSARLGNSGAFRSVLLTLYVLCFAASTVLFGLAMTFVLGVLVAFAGLVRVPGKTWECRDCDWQGN